MIPVASLGIDNKRLNKELVINVDSNIPIYTSVYDAGFQFSNLTQSSLIKYSLAYTFHLHY